MSQNNIPCEKMESQKKFKYYTEDLDVQKFLAHVELEAALKDYVDEKKAQYVVSKLMGPALEVYLRLTVADKKDFDKIKEELLKEFLRGQLDREEAIAVLESRKRGPDESSLTFSYKIVELVKLAYPTFSAAVQSSLSKDYFVRGLRKEIQIALKSSATYSTMDIKAASEEVVRLELAGIVSSKTKTNTFNSCEASNETLIEAIADKVLEKLTIAKESDETERSEVHSIGSGGSRRGRYNTRGRYNSFRGASRDSSIRGSRRKCRSCNSTEHFIKDCPTKFCEACGQRGCNQRNEKCPNFQK